jgi:hypothetical protein
VIDRLSGRSALLIGVAAVLVVALVGWFAFLAPQRAKVRELEGEITRTQLQLGATEALVNSTALEESGRELARLRAAIPDEVRMNEILRQLAQAGADARVGLTAITPQAPVSSGAADTIPISLTVQGSYTGLRNFLRLLRTRAALDGEELRASGRLFSIESIQFAGGGDERGTPLIQAVLTVRAYAFRGTPTTPNAAVPPPAAPATEASG